MSPKPPAGKPSATKSRKHSGPFAELAKLKEKLVEAEKAPAPPPGKVAQPAPSKTKQRTTQPTPGTESADTVTFARLMTGVAMLDQQGPHRVPATSADPGRDFRETKLENFRTKEEEEELEAREQLRALAMGGVRFEVSDDGSHVEGRRIDVTPALLRKLRRGMFPVDARLDLHGLVLEAAREALLAFLARQRQRGETMVLVVHGKGEHSPGGIGILRGEIAAWLSQGKACEHVAAFATAQRDDGGEGATYVLLRR